MSLEPGEEGWSGDVSICERLQTELDLLHTMYPDSVTFKPISKDLEFKPNESSVAKLILRLPDTYPDRGAPDVLQATGKNKADLRQEFSRAFKELWEDLGGGEVLDAAVARFVELVDYNAREAQEEVGQRQNDRGTQQQSKTVVIWLHHLLATSKRKLALRPSSSSSSVSGVTKPGYPGIMVFAGLQEAVDEHVSELKSLNWQAFSVRYEEEEEWVLGDRRGGGINEVETMAEVVQMIEERKREVFLKAAGVK